MSDQGGIPLAVAVQTHIDDQVPMNRNWRRFSGEQRKLADALDQELVRLMKKVGADDYFGALGLAPTSNFSSISSAANSISTRFCEECVRTYGLNRKAGGWVVKARKIDALARHALNSLQIMKQEGTLDAYAAKRRSALIMEMAHPAAPPVHAADHQGERAGG